MSFSKVKNVMPIRWRMQISRVLPVDREELTFQLKYYIVDLLTSLIIVRKRLNTTKKVYI